MALNTIHSIVVWSAVHFVRTYPVTAPSWFYRRSIIASHFEAIIRGYRHHSSDVPTYNPTHTIGYYGLTWDYPALRS